MLPLLIAILIAKPASDLDRITIENLPAGCRAERIGGPALRLRVASGQWRDTGAVTDANIDHLPWVGGRVVGDFEVVLRVQLKLPVEPLAAGITRIITDPDGTRVESIPLAVGGLHLTAGQRDYATATARYERTGRNQRVWANFALSSANMAAGGAAGGVSDPAAATWLAVRRRGTTLERRGGPEVDGRANWCNWMADEFPLPEVLELRLFATGNLNQPFGVEFDHITILSLPEAKK